MDDRGLVAAFAAGDRLALAAVYEAYANQLYDYCITRLSDQDAAAEVITDTFVIVNARIGELRDPDRLQPWLLAIARQECLRRRTDAGPLTGTAELPADLARRVSDAVEDPELADHRERLIQRVGPFGPDGFPTEPAAAEPEAFSGPELPTEPESPTEFLPVVAVSTVAVSTELDLPTEPVRRDRRRLLIPVAAGAVLLLVVGGIVLLRQPSTPATNPPVALNAAPPTVPATATSAASVLPSPISSNVPASTTTTTPAVRTTARPTNTQQPAPPVIPPTQAPATPSTTTGSTPALPGTLSVSPAAVTLSSSGAGSVTLTANGGPVSWSAIPVSDAGGGLTISPSSGTTDTGKSVLVNFAVDLAKEGASGSIVVTFSSITSSQQVKLTWP